MGGIPVCGPRRVRRERGCGSGLDPWRGRLGGVARGSGRPSRRTSGGRGRGCDRLPCGRAHRIRARNRVRCGCTSRVHRSGRCGFGDALGRGRLARSGRRQRRPGRGGASAWRIGGRRWSAHAASVVRAEAFDMAGGKRRSDGGTSCTPCIQFKSIAWAMPDRRRRRAGIARDRPCPGLLSRAPRQSRTPEQGKDDADQEAGNVRPPGDRAEGRADIGEQDLHDRPEADQQ